MLITITQPEMILGMDHSVLSRLFEVTWGTSPRVVTKMRVLPVEASLLVYNQR